MSKVNHIKIGIIGLGYVGLPLAVAFAKRFPGTIGFDVNQIRVSELSEGKDINGDIDSRDLKAAKLKFSSSENDLRGLNFYAVAVPTPIDADKRPDLSALRSASELVGRVISKNATVVYESTVYPGVTEEFCAPIIEKVSGLKCGKDFFIGYSPERVNPGDREHTIEKIIKVVSGDTPKTLELVSEVYGAVITAGIHKASSIKVAEAAKVIENTQRDLNIALMNELSIIFDRLNISTKDVLEAAQTKWNFLKFTPGLVGGHCIGVDPYYLTTKAEQLGYRPQVILAGRRINDAMGTYIAQRAVKLMIKSGFQIKNAKVGILGLTFKENVSDLRNSRVPDIIDELREYGVNILVHDPLASKDEAKSEYGIEISNLDEFKNLNALILAVSHADYAKFSITDFESRLESGGIFVDVKSRFSRGEFSNNIHYWSL